MYGVGVSATCAVTGNNELVGWQGADGTVCQWRLDKITQAEWLEGQVVSQTLSEGGWVVLHETLSLAKCSVGCKERRVGC